jgi:hypothetical protein
MLYSDAMVAQSSLRAGRKFSWSIGMNNKSKEGRPQWHYLKVPIPRQLRAVARMERSGIREQMAWQTVFPAFRWRFMRATSCALCGSGAVSLIKSA